MTGDKQLRDECVRILRRGIRDGALAMHRGPRGETKDLYHCAEMYAYFLRESDLVDEADWPRLIRENPPPLLFDTRTVVFWLDAYWRWQVA